MEQNEIYQHILRLLSEEGIECVGCIPLSEATVYLPRLLPESIRSIVLFSVLIYELVGPMLTKIALTKAGDIHPKEETPASK